MIYSRNTHKSIPVALRGTFALLLIGMLLLPLTFAQSGRPTPPPPKPQPPPAGQGRKPTGQTEDTRPRRVGDDQQDDKPLKLKADLVTVITSVTDTSGNQINDLTQKD